MFQGHPDIRGPPSLAGLCFLCPECGHHLPHHPGGTPSLCLPTCPLEPGCWRRLPRHPGHPQPVFPTCSLLGPQHTLRGLAADLSMELLSNRECSSQTRRLHISKLHRLILVNKLGSRVTVQLQSSVMMFSVVHTTSPQTKAAQTLGCPGTVV